MRNHSEPILSRVACYKTHSIHRPPIGRGRWRSAMWTQETRTMAKHLWLERMKAHLIATNVNTKHGCSLTRNAIIGMANREKWGRRKPANYYVRGGQPLVRLPPRRVATGNYGEGGVVITDLKFRQCKWPVAYRDNRHYFCGASCEKSYCADHYEGSIEHV